VDPVTARLVAALPTYGPPLIFALAVLETCFLTGLVVPSGLAIAAGTVLALGGGLSLEAVVFAAVAGGALGDSVGYWVGREAGERVLSGRWRLARMVRSRDHQLARFFGRTPFYSVTVARLVSFVRTVMPMVAGMSGLSYPRFLAFELVGLVGCVGLYVGIGTLSEGSWQALTHLMGVGGAVTLLALTAAAWSWLTRRGGGQGGEGGGC
jgi:membrane-associated protein